MAKKFDIVIVGAGLVGSAFALWLARNTNYRIALLERNAALEKPQVPNERVVALGWLASSYLDDIGILSQLDSGYLHAYDSMFIWDEHSNGELNFDASLLRQETQKNTPIVDIDSSVTSMSNLGYMADSVYCNYLCQQAALEHAGIETYFDTELLSLELSKELTHLNSETTVLKANLVIAADGVNSWVRRAVKIFANQRDYHQRGIVTRISTSRPHQDCAWQRFLETGPVAILPLGGGQSSIVWSVDDLVADELMALNDFQFSGRLEHALDGRLGEIEVLAQRRAFPLKSLRADLYYRRNVVLVGDAAHSIHPLAGQGANLGFKDIKCLGELIIQTQNSRELTSPELLERYQSRRQASNNQTDALMSALHRTYQNSWPMWMAMRGVGMNLLNRSNSLRRLFIELSAGY